MRYKEHELQKACVKYFRLAYPQYAYMLFAVPNGGQRTATQGRILKEEGLVAGVSDLILLIPRRGFGALCLEFKTKNGTQEIEQKVWQQETEKAGNKYMIVRDIMQFKLIVLDYLGEKGNDGTDEAREQLKMCLNGSKTRKNDQKM